MPKQRNNRWKILDHAYLSTAFTFMLIELSLSGAGFFDSLITGSMLGEKALAAVGIGHPVFSIITIMSVVLASGMQRLCSKEIGRGNYKRFSSISTVTLLTGTVLSLLVAAVMWIFLRPMTVLLGASGNSAELLEPAMDYIRGLIIGAPALFLTTITSQVVQMDNSGGIARIGAVVSAVVDIVLDIAAVKWGLGLYGMGLATSISIYANLLIQLTHFLKRDRMLHLQVRRKDFADLGPVLAVGSQVLTGKLANIARPVLINNYIILLGGTAAMSALSAKNSLTAFISVVRIGLASAFPLVMGMVYGEKSREDMTHVGHVTHKYALLFNAAMALLLAVFSTPLASLFISPESDIFPMVVYSLFMIAGETLAETLIYSRVSYLSIISKVFDSQLLLFGVRLLAIIPSVLVLGNLFGVYGVLSSFLCADILLLLAVYIACALYSKKVKVSAAEFMRLEEGFDVPACDVIELDIRSMEDATLVSEQVQLFCRGHRVDGKIGYYAALALEESVALIYRNNAFSPKLHIDLRVLIQNGELTLRIRDNGSSAYPFGGLEEDGSREDPFANIGVTLLRKIAKDVRYYHTLSINYTIITVDGTGKTGMK